MSLRKVFALALVLCMVLSLFPASAFAEDVLIEEIEEVENVPAENYEEIIEGVIPENTGAPVEEVELVENVENEETSANNNVVPAIEENNDVLILKAPAPAEEPKTEDQPDENEQPALPSLEAQEVAQLGDASSVLDDVTLRQALENGGEITLSANIVMTKNVEIQNDVTMDLAGHAITSTQDDLFTVKNGTLTINDTAGGGSIYTSSWTALNASGGNIVVNAGKIGAYNRNTAYKTTNGSITFNGGMINQTDTYYTVGTGLTTYTGYGENAGYYIFAPATVTAVTPAAFELAVNNTRELTATTAENVTLHWSSSDTNVATVDENGTVTAVGTGSATIYAANAVTGSYASATVTIGNAVFKNLTSNNEYASLQVAVNEANSGETIRLTTNTTIATVATIPTGKTLTLDLNGNTLTESTNGTRLIKNEGNLTVTGDGTITNSTNATVNNSYGLIDNYGKLIIENGTYYDYGQGGGGTLRNFSGGTMTVKAGTTIEAYGTDSGNATISNSGTLNIEDCVSLKNHATDGNAGNGYGLYCIKIDGGTTTIGTVDSINPVNIDGNRGAIGINGGRLTINSGTFKGSIYRDLWITNDGANTAVTINGGYFIGTTTSESILAGIDDGNQDESDVAVTINGGFFNKAVRLGDKDSKNEWTFAIQGGSYKTAPVEKLIVTGYKVVEDTGAEYRYTVVPANVAEIGGTGYTTLAAAIADVPTDGNPTTITMIADSVEAECITIGANQNVVLDLAGFTVSGSVADNTKSYYFITNKGTLEIKDTVDNGKISYVNTTPDTGYHKEVCTIYNAAVLTLTSGTIENTTSGGASYAVTTSSNAWGSGDDKDVQFYMNGGVLTCPGGDQALRVYQNCADTTNPRSHNTVIISGGKILDTGIFLDNYIYNPQQGTSGEGIFTSVTIGSNAEIHGLIDLKLRHAFNTSLTITGGDFSNAQLRVRKVTAEWNANVTEPTDPIVHISGGKFAFGSASFTETGWTTYTKIFDISGGVFSVDLNDFSFIQFPKGKTGVANEDPATMEAYHYTVGVAPATPVAQIGETKYTTLAEAFAAANEAGSAEIVLLQDCELSAPVTLDANITLNLANFKITVANNEVTQAGIEVISSANGGIAQTINGTEFKTTNACGATLIQNNGTLIITGGGAIDGSAVTADNYKNNTDTLYLINNSGTLTIENGDFDLNKAIKSVVVRNAGTATLNGGNYDAWSTVLNDGGGTMNLTGGNYTGWGYDGSPAGTYRYAVAQYGNGSHLTISDGVTVSGIHGGLGVSEGYLTVNGGSFSTRNTDTVNADGTVTVASNSNTYYGGYFAGERGNVVVEINGGTFESAGGKPSIYVGNDNMYGDGGLNMPARVTINGGTFESTGAATNIAAGTGAAVIYGGTYIGTSFNNMSYVAEGYEAVKTADGGAVKTWKVGEIKVAPPTQAGTATDGYDATYNATKKVVDEEGQTIQSETPLIINVKATENSNVTKNEVDSYTLQSVVTEAVAAAQSDATTLNVDLSLVLSEPVTETNKVVYEVHPEATVKAGDTELARFEVTNEQLGSNASFTFKLSVPDSLVTGEAPHYVKVTHISEDTDYGTETGTYAVQGGVGSYYVEVTTDHFSKFELALPEDVAPVTAKASYSATIALADSIDIFFNVKNITEGNPANFRVDYTYKDVTGSAACTQADWNSFKVASCAAKEVGDIVNIKVVYTEDEKEAELFSIDYSIRQYCENQVKKDSNSENLKNLCKAVLDYGAYAQLEFNYNINNLANATYSYGIGNVTSIPAEYNNMSSSGTCSSITRASATLGLESNTQVVFYLTPAAGVTPEDIPISVKAGDGAPVNVPAGTSGNYVRSMENGRIKIVINGTAAKNLDTVYSVIVSDGNNERTLTYSALTYPAKYYTAGGTTGDVCKALYNYYTLTQNVL